MSHEFYPYDPFVEVPAMPPAIESVEAALSQSDDPGWQQVALGAQAVTRTVYRRYRPGYEWRNRSDGRLFSELAHLPAIDADDLWQEAIIRLYPDSKSDEETAPDSTGESEITQNKSASEWASWRTLVSIRRHMDAMRGIKVAWAEANELRTLDPEVLDQHEPYGVTIEDDLSDLAQFRRTETVSLDELVAAQGDEATIDDLDDVVRQSARKLYDPQESVEATTDPALLAYARHKVSDKQWEALKATVDQTFEQAAEQIGGSPSAVWAKRQNGLRSIHDGLATARDDNHDYPHIAALLDQEGWDAAALMGAPLHELAGPGIEDLAFPLTEEGLEQLTDRKICAQRTPHQEINLCIDALKAIKGCTRTSRWTLNEAIGRPQTTYLRRRASELEDLVWGNPARKPPTPLQRVLQDDKLQLFDVWQNWNGSYVGPAINAEVDAVASSFLTFLQVRTLARFIKHARAALAEANIVHEPDGNYRYIEPER